MKQNINNKGNVERQVNIQENTGPVIFANRTRFSKRFDKLNREVASDIRYDGIMESLKHYLTSRDGVDMPTKLKEGGFAEHEILEAMIQKDKFARKLEMNKFYESAQWIDSQLFAKIKMDFGAFVMPLINDGAVKNVILQEVVVKVICPVLDLINIEGENDEVLNYTADDIFGMIYYLTGQCHLNWKIYDNI